jgi:hypothetical protein
MLDELQSIDENGTWTLTTLPAGHRAIGLKWVYKVKKDEYGCIVKHKACLVAKGYVQRPGVDFEEVFALVARLESVWLILALAVHRGWEVHHMDVKSAFLNGELEEVVYVSQPSGFIAWCVQATQGSVRSVSSSPGLECQAGHEPIVPGLHAQRLVAWSLRTRKGRRAAHRRRVHR